MIRIALIASLLGCVVSDGHTPIGLFPQSRMPGHLPAMGPEVCVEGSDNATTCTNISVPSVVPFLAHGADTAVVIAPGGGFQGLSYSTEGTDIAKWLNSLGVSAFVLKYRVPAMFGYGEVPMMDAQRAMRVIRSRADRFGLNASRIGFMGFSAGGDLAAGIAASFAIRAYEQIDAIDELTCRPDFVLMVYPAVHGWIENITSEHPPAFFAQAENDPVSSELTMQYYLRLKNFSVAAADLHIFHGAVHGYGLCNVRDAQGRIACLVGSPEGPGLMPSWMPWSNVCLWPQMAQAFLQDLGLLSGSPKMIIV